MVRPNGLPKLGPNDHAWSLRRRTASKKHDPTASVLKRGLKEAHSNTQRYTAASKVPSITRNGPRIFLQLFQSLRELELTLLHWKEEPGRRP